ncbi:MAG: methyl-accepting chemotaxis protein [Planctomycetota bacterium]|jgi:methyl-accepting chemotaxis protein
MSSSRLPFHNRLVGRMVLLGVLPTVLLLALIVVIATSRTYRARLEAVREQLRAEAALAARVIEDGNNNAVLSARRMAEAQAAGLFGQRAAGVAYARSVLAASPELTAAYFAYEPDADGRDAEALAGGTVPTEAMDAAGRFLPYWFLNPQRGNAITLEPCVDMETSLYYQGVKDVYARTGRAEGMITEPYVYEGKMIVEQVFPIIVDGEFMGVGGVDRGLAELETALAAAAARIDADAFLLSSKGSFIAATSAMSSGAGSMVDTAALKTRHVSETAYGELFGGFLRDQRPLFLAEAEAPTTGERDYFAVVEIPTGGWTLILRRSEAAVTAPIRAALLSNIAIVAGGTLVICALLIGLAVLISRRVNLAARAATRVAAGDLTGEPSGSTSPDESGVLLRALDQMNANLNGLVGQVKQSSIKLNSTATEVAATSREQESTAKSFGSATSQIAAAAKQISVTSTELVQTMKDVDEVARKTTGLADEGREGLESMHATMRELDEATRSIAEKLAVINDKTSRITGVVTTINKVADQTNLLSVNAAIEAEKAGEYGQGFLVVAREIRRLADQTGGATLDIEKMVQQMQSAVASGVMEMERFADRVRHVVADVGRMSEQLGHIIDNVNQNTASFGLVNEGMQSQSQGACQISEAMGQLTADAQRTSESIREYVQAADELHEAVAGLRAAIASFELKSG